MYSQRAEPLAAWTAGYELADLVADADRACLVLETGVNQRWRYGSYRRTPENTAEARAWQDAKGAVGCALPGFCKQEEGPGRGAMCGRKDQKVAAEVRSQVR